MGFRFKRKELVDKAVRRICCERLACACRRLKGDDRVEAIHETRKEIKKLRAVLRLFRDEIRNRQFKKINNSLRKAAGFLTASRDAQVRSKALEELLHQARLKSLAGLDETAATAARKELQRFEKRKCVTAIKTAFKKVRGDLKQLDVRRDGWKAVEQGLLKSYRRSRTAFEQARRRPSAKNLHEWRKRSKDLWYQLNLLCSVWPKEIQALNNQLETLTDMLGDDHDLEMLKQFIADTGGSSRQAGPTTVIDRFIEGRQRELRSRAMSLGTKFFVTPSPSFCPGLKNRWKLWHTRN